MGPLILASEDAHSLVLGGVSGAGEYASGFSAVRDMIEDSAFGSIVGLGCCFRSLEDCVIEMCTAVLSMWRPLISYLSLFIVEKKHTRKIRASGKNANLGSVIEAVCKFVLFFAQRFEALCKFAN